MSSGRRPDTSAAEIERRPEDLRCPGHRHLCRCFDCYLWRADAPNRAKIREQRRRWAEKAARRRARLGPEELALDRKRKREARRRRFEQGLPPGDPRHGQLHAARDYGCGCGPCVAARAESVEAMRARRAAQGLPADSPLHGTLAGYNGWSCRCPPCKAAVSERNRARREAKQRQGLPPGDPRHGRASGYDEWRCRCDACRDYNRLRPQRGRP